MQLKECTTKEANELDQVATASVNFYPGNKIFILVSCLNRCFFCSNRLYLSCLHKLFCALALGNKKEGCFNRHKDIFLVKLFRLVGSF